MADTPSAAQMWEWCVTHDLSVPPGEDDCGGGEAGSCEVVPEKPDAQLIESIGAEFDAVD